jgi:hypothetical protein
LRANKLLLVLLLRFPVLLIPLLALPSLPKLLNMLSWHQLLLLLLQLLPQRSYSSTARPRQSSSKREKHCASFAHNC